MTNYGRSLKVEYHPVAKRKAAAELELRQRAASSGKRSADELIESSHHDPAFFIHNCIIIDNAQPEGDDDATPSEMPFHMWDAQRGLLADILSERLLLILKARQLGISWLVCAYALWLCLFRPGRLVLMFSIGQGEANELMRRVQVMYYRLPADMRAKLPSVTEENKTAFGWSNGSKIESLPSRKSAGSGYTASLIILDEFSKNENDASLYTAVKPTVDGGGKMIILSTANGTDNLFYELCQKAIKGAGKFVFRFLPWWDRPGRTPEWYASVAADAIDSSHMGQEYPATPEEAFAATSVDRFLQSMITWDACFAVLSPLSLVEPMILAADAGVTSDSFALVGVTRHPTDNDHVAVRYVRVWYPPKGGALDFDQIEVEIRDIVDRWNVLLLVYDQYQLHQMMTRLHTDGTVATSAFSQGTDRLIADKQLWDIINQRRIAHDNDSELRQAIDNADRKVAPDGRNIRIIKRKEQLKIDAAVALSMAAYTCLDLNL